MDIFQFVDRVKPEPCLMNDELYLEKRRWFRWDQIQSLPPDVAYLKLYSVIISVCQYTLLGR